MKYLSLHDRLRGPIADDLKKELKITNALALPRIEKVVVNVGINRTKMDSQELRDYVVDCLTKITGQKPVLTKAKKAISNFKTRQGMVVGAMVTLRGRHMEEFLDRLLSYAIPRIRDFRGVTTKFDGHGNYAIGIRDHSIFPEVPPPDAKQIFGIQIQLALKAESDDEARALLKGMGMPFRKETKETKEIKKAKPFDSAPFNSLQGKQGKKAKQDAPLTNDDSVSAKVADGEEHGKNEVKRSRKSSRTS